ncbi:MAG: ribosome hibernation-promoting factor, HPF/YfiA family [Planctomycetota bacterium]|jgi:putative sigma-54 modulation protein
MEITISGRHTSVTQAMKRHATEKLSRLERHNDMLTRAEVVMNVEGDRQTIEMIAHCRKGGPLIGKVEHDDMYAAVDLLVDKMNGQVRRHKEKAKNNSGRLSLRDLATQASEEMAVSRANADDEEA